MIEAGVPLLSVEKLQVRYRSAGREVPAVDGVDLDIERGETVGLVGESGCGKSTLGRAILRLTPASGGDIRLGGTSIAQLGQRALRAQRRRMQMVFQDPYGSLNPRQTVGTLLDTALKVHRLGDAAVRRQRAAAIVRRVGLPATALERYPHEFSGGERQRIGIARALAVEPKLIVCDEPVSALDVSIQAQVINLLEDLQQKFALAYLFVAHDLAVVEHISKRIAVMYLGRIVETAPARDLYVSPRHPYTEALLSAVPIPDPQVKRQRIRLAGEVPSPIHPPQGCHFHTRCPIAQFPLCSRAAPPLKQSSEGHWVACHFR